MGEPGEPEVDRVDDMARSSSEEPEWAQSLELEALVNVATILAQPGSIEERAEAVLAEVIRATNADRVFLRIADREQNGLRLLTTAGAGIPRVPPRNLLPYGQGLSGAAFLEGTAVVANDYPSHSLARPEVASDGIKSAVALPVKFEGRTLGTIYIGSRQPAYFTDARVRFASAIAGGAGTVQQIVRLYGELDAASLVWRRRLEALCIAATKMAMDEDPGDALKGLVEIARRLIGARYGAVALWTASGEISQYVASGLTPKEQQAIGTPPRGDGVLGFLKSDGHSIRVSDIASHPSFSGFPPGHPSMKSFLGSPIKTRAGLAGAFYLADKEGAIIFSADDEVTLHHYAALAGVLLENSALFEGVTTANAQLRTRVQELTALNELFQDHLRTRYELAEAYQSVANRFERHAQEFSSILEEVRAKKIILTADFRPNSEEPHTDVTE